MFPDRILIKAVESLRASPARLLTLRFLFGSFWAFPGNRHLTGRATVSVGASALGRAVGATSFRACVPLSCHPQLF